MHSLIKDMACIKSESALSLLTRPMKILNLNIIDQLQFSEPVSLVRLLVFFSPHQHF